MRLLVRPWLPAFAALVAVAVAGCGGGSQAMTTTSRTASQRQHAPTQTTPAVPGSPAPGQPAGAASVHVIRAWADALRRGDINAAASYFAVPSTFADGSDAPQRIHSREQARVVNAELPCGAKLISTSRLGPYVNALFELSGRRGPGGTSCNPGAGDTARTDFLIRDGRIVAWIRAPDQPGDHPGSTSSGGGGPVI